MPGTGSPGGPWLACTPAGGDGRVALSTSEAGDPHIYVWDAATETLVWRASVSRVFSSNVQKAERQVVKAIEKMFKEGRKLYERANR